MRSAYNRRYRIFIRYENAPEAPREEPEGSNLRHTVGVDPAAAADPRLDPRLPRIHGNAADPRGDGDRAGFFHTKLGRRSSSGACPQGSDRDGPRRVAWLATQGPGRTAPGNAA